VCLLLFISCSVVPFADTNSCSHTQNVWNITHIWHTKMNNLWEMVYSEWGKYGLMNHQVFLQKLISVKAHLLSIKCLFNNETRHCNDHTKCCMWPLEVLKLNIKFTSLHSRFWAQSLIFTYTFLRQGSACFIMCQITSFWTPLLFIWIL
jgi:hypothetical protein